MTWYELIQIEWYYFHQISRHTPWGYIVIVTENHVHENMKYLKISSNSIDTEWWFTIEIVHFSFREFQWEFHQCLHFIWKLIKITKRDFKRHFSVYLMILICIWWFWIITVRKFDFHTFYPCYIRIRYSCTRTP